LVDQFNLGLGLEVVEEKIELTEVEFEVEAEANLDMIDLHSQRTELSLYEAEDADGVPVFE